MDEPNSKLSFRELLYDLPGWIYAKRDDAGEEKVHPLQD